MSRVKAPAHLPELVRTAFAKARSDGDLHYFPTKVAVSSVNSIPFQLRFCPSLANKSKGAPPANRSEPHKPFDPFAYPPGALFITDLGPAHFLVLNKFAVVPEHFILATRDYKLQTHLLEADDLESTLACLEAYEDARNTQGQTQATEDGLFAFFNCGEHSGASQPHRHIQLLPVARMRDGLVGDQNGWSVLADRLHSTKPPFVTFSEIISTGMSGSDLHEAYLRLYRRACHAVASHTKQTATGAKGSSISTTGEARISYNMAMTKSSLVICPRLAEGAKVLDDSGGVLGSLAVNGTLLAGTAMVKAEAEWHALRNEGGLENLLRNIGIPTDQFVEDSNKL